ncbi:FAD-binding domain-containing protein [Xylaria sp. CBS 124048]|nr:FAD-binding domain-containing protein [Xylaria sp. CBS 124048]
MSFVAALQGHVKALQPALPIITPSDANWAATKASFVNHESKTPAAIARPQNAAHVQALVQYCTKNGVEFAVRTGGHDAAGRNQVKGGLTIDMRDIKKVTISADGKTATIGGGVLVRDLATQLETRGLVTPVGSVGSVGYVGWATYGGYGLFGARYGLGVDQIVGAKIVDAKGELVEAAADLLKGIRGAGGAFGVIVELTVKTYPLKQLLTSLVVYESSDMKATWTNYTAGYDKLVAEGGLPDSLMLQLFGMELPGLGKVLAVIATWVDDDHEEGKKWIAKVASFNNVIMNNPEPKTVSAYAAFNESMVVYGCHGRSYTLNLRRQKKSTAELFAKFVDQLPGGGISMLVYNYRANAPRADSVFGAQDDHLLCEFLASTPMAEFEAKGAEWARNAMVEIRKSEAENVLETAYISLLADEDTDPKKIYGVHYDTVAALKKKYDPTNVFKHAVPRITV